jgi:hypothetical protein
MSFRSTIVAAALLATAANAHITMQEPVIYSQDKALIDTAPLMPAQFPCHSQYGFEITKMNAMTVGTPMKAKLKGSAIHGGGSCQLSITTDMEPTKDSKFKVIKSWEGNCPMSTDAELDYTIPDSIPNGKATFAWTWFSVLSGGPELYMNCAPIEVSGGASDNSAFDALPDMLVANLGDATTCRSVTGSPMKFPNPGADLVTAGDKPALLPTGDCGATGTTPSTPATPSEAPVASTPATPSEAPVASAPSVPSLAPVASAPSVPSMAPVASAPSAPAPEETDLTCEPDETPAPSAPVATPAPSAPVAAPVPTGAPASPAPVAGGSACTTNGAIMCNGTAQFGLCNNGSVVWQAVAAGTTCVNGAIMKRSSAFKASYNGRIVRSRAAVAYKA